MLGHINKMKYRAIMEERKKNKMEKSLNTQDHTHLESSPWRRRRQQQQPPPGACHQMAAVGRPVANHGTRKLLVKHKIFRSKNSRGLSPETGEKWTYLLSNSLNRSNENSMTWIFRVVMSIMGNVGEIYAKNDNWHTQQHFQGQSNSRHFTGA